MTCMKVSSTKFHGEHWQEMVHMGVSTVMVKNSKRFARSLKIQEEGIEWASGHGIDVVCLDRPACFVDKSRRGVMMRQIEGAVNEADKGEVVDNMSRGRDMAREKIFKTKTYLTRKGNGKCSGRKTLMHTYGKKLSGAVKRLLMMPYTRRQMKARKATMSWSQLGNALVANGLVTRKVPGEYNYTDLGTKGHPAPRFLTLRNMLNIVDCKQIDGEKEIEACSVQALPEEGWQTKAGKGAMRLERKLLLALLACAPATGDAASRALIKTGSAVERAASQAATLTESAANSSWTGWFVAFLVILVFAMKHLWENYEIRRIVPAAPAKATRTMIVQGPVTYATENRLSPVCAGRYQPLADREFDCWVTS
jgi:hypothetical protein